MVFKKTRIYPFD